jgi:hypothetical protein
MQKDKIIFDWYDIFSYNFSRDSDIPYLKEKKIHGSLTINFKDGIPQDCELRQRKICLQKMN